MAMIFLSIMRSSDVCIRYNHNVLIWASDAAVLAHVSLFESSYMYECLHNRVTV